MKKVFIGAVLSLAAGYANADDIILTCKVNGNSEERVVVFDEGFDRTTGRRAYSVSFYNGPLGAPDTVETDRINNCKASYYFDVYRLAVPHALESARVSAQCGDEFELYYKKHREGSCHGGASGASSCSDTSDTTEITVGGVEIDVRRCYPNWN